MGRLGRGDSISWLGRGDSISRLGSGDIVVIALLVIILLVITLLVIGGGDRGGPSGLGGLGDLVIAAIE